MKDFDKKGISERLLILRKNNNLTQQIVSKDTRINQSNIAKYEIGQRVPSIPDLIILADYYNTTTDYILTGVSSENKAIVKNFGLDNESLECLKFLYNISKNKDDYNQDTINNAKSILNAINTLLQREKSIRFFGSIYDFFELAHKKDEYKNLVTKIDNEVISNINPDSFVNAIEEHLLDTIKKCLFNIRDDIDK